MLLSQAYTMTSAVSPQRRRGQLSERRVEWASKPLDAVSTSQRMDLRSFVVLITVAALIG